PCEPDLKREVFAITGDVRKHLYERVLNSLVGIVRIAQVLVGDSDRPPLLIGNELTITFARRIPVAIGGPALDLRGQLRVRRRRYLRRESAGGRCGCPPGRRSTHGIRLERFGPLPGLQLYSTMPFLFVGLLARRTQQMSTQVERAHGLEALGIVRSGRVHWNLSPAVLYEIAIQRNEAILASEGPLVARTGQHTGRSPQDKFTVKEPSTEQNISWGTLNRPITEANFDALHRDMMTYVQDKELYVLDAWGGADPAHRLPVRIVTEFAWHNLFVRNMFIPELDPEKR